MGTANRAAGVKRGRRRQQSPEKSEQATPKVEELFGFSVLVDPRIERCKRYELSELLTIALCAVLSGAEGWIAIEQWALGKEAWLRTFLELPNGIASHDTFARVFARLRPEQLSECLLGWTRKLHAAIGVHGGVIAIDGKRLRRSFEQDPKDALHLLTAWSSEARVVLAQRKVDGKHNEISEIPALLAKLDIAGCIVTLDAMGTQKAVAEKIRQAKADYVLTLKANHPKLRTYAQQRIDAVVQRGFRTVQGERVQHDEQRTVDGDHGRLETRTVTAVSVGDRFAELHPGWTDANTLVRVHRVRERNDVTKEQTCYFISSLPADNAKVIAASIRAHWSIENDLHWSLDVQMNEDACRIRKDHGPENLAALRRCALSLLKQERSLKVGVKTKQLRAAADNQYLMKLLNF